MQALCSHDHTPVSVSTTALAASYLVHQLQERFCHLSKHLFSLFMAKINA